MKRSLLVSIVLVFSMMCWSFESSMHPDSQIRFVKSQIEKESEPYYSAYLDLISKTDSLLAETHHACVDFSVPGFYFNPEEHRRNSLALSEDAFAAYACALAYRISGEDKYGAKACYFLNAWATVNQTYSNADGELVLAYNGTALLIAGELMYTSGVWCQTDKERFTGWITKVYQPAVNSIRNRTNNWGDWGRFGSLLCASLLGDSNEVDKNMYLIQSDLPTKIAPDGRMKEEIKREKNGLWYTYFSLAPITASCWLIYNLTGTNLFLTEKEGALIKSALDYLLYYCVKPEEWPWCASPRSGEGEPWPENLFEAMNTVYCENQYDKFVRPFRPVVYPYHSYAWTFPTLMPVIIGNYHGQSCAEPRFNLK